MLEPWKVELVSVKIKQKNKGWLKKLLKSYSDESVLAVGYPASKTGALKYPDGTSVTLVAAVNNFGSESRNIPARPFMTEGGPAAVEATNPIAEALVPALNKGKITKEEILQHMGDPAAAAFKDTITNGAWEPNAPSTIAQKGSSKPLIDTALMHNSLTYEVRKR